MGFPDMKRLVLENDGFWICIKVDDYKAVLVDINLLKPNDQLHTTFVFSLEILSQMVF